MAIQEARRTTPSGLTSKVSCATAATPTESSRACTGQRHHETSDAYSGVIAQLCARHRVVVCKDAIQWILQRRKSGGAERPWRGVGWYRSRDALIRASAALCGRIDSAAMATLLALPANFGGSQ